MFVVYKRSTASGRYTKWTRTMQFVQAEIERCYRTVWKTRPESWQNIYSDVQSTAVPSNFVTGTRFACSMCSFSPERPFSYYRCQFSNSLWRSSFLLTLLALSCKLKYTSAYETVNSEPLRIFGHFPLSVHLKFKNTRRFGNWVCFCHKVKPYNWLECLGS
jgi:hypothetical protein